MGTNARYFVGAYAASPNTVNWDPVLEESFYNGLRSLQRIRGLEHPFYGSLHRYDSLWFIKRIRSDWEFLFTCIPGTMDRLRSDPKFGLASADSEGRAAALSFMKQAQEAVSELNCHLGRKAVVGVALHSAPTRTLEAQSSAAWFSESLLRIREWDWNGAKLLVEHCDAFRPEWPPSKGFLNLEDELNAIAQTNHCRTETGILINWGRSALEGHSVSTPLQHLRKSLDSGSLAGLMFSGVCATDSIYGSWLDSHAPFARHYPNSLMTEQTVRAALQVYEKPGVLGFKIQTLPQSLSLRERLRLIESSLEYLSGLSR